MISWKSADSWGGVRLAEIVILKAASEAEREHAGGGGHSATLHVLEPGRLITGPFGVRFAETVTLKAVSEAEREYTGHSANYWQGGKH
jgi:hypothetical protein